MPEVRQSLEMPLGHGDFFGTENAINWKITMINTIWRLSLPNSLKLAFIPFLLKSDPQDGKAKVVTYS